MKLTEKTKRYLAIGGGAVICIGLIAAISLQFGNAPAGEDAPPEESSAVTEIVVNPSDVQKEEPGEDEKLVIKTETSTAVKKEEGTQPVDSRPAQTDQTEQSIQPDVTKPEVPSEEILTDPPVPVEHEEVITPPETTPAVGEPQAGDTQNGQIYVPGFGWVENQGGGGSGTTADDMYENGNKIGVMD